MATKRRGNGEGSIFRRADGIWAATVANGYGTNGKRHRKTVYGKTKKEVQGKLFDLQQRQKLGTLPTSKGTTVAQYLSRWLEESAKSSVRPTTHERYEIIIRKQINPHIGGIRLERLTAPDVQTFYSDLEKQGTSPRLRQFSHAVLRVALGQACKWGLISRNVCELVSQPKVPRREITTLSGEQAAKLLKTAEDDRFYALYVLAITTGMRQGELFGLKWSDLDLESANLSVNRTALLIDGTMTTGEPKTAKSKRLISLPELAVKALRAHRNKMDAESYAETVWVFCDSRGGLCRRTNFMRHSFRPLLTRAELPAIRFHDLRHTAATLLLAEGVHPKIVQERLGHSKIATTLDTYSHVVPSMQKDAADRLDKMFPEE